MTRRIKFEGVLHEFPDDFTDSEIQGALSGSSQDSSLNNEQNPYKNTFGFQEQLNRLKENMPSTYQNPLNIVGDVATGLGKAGQGIASTLTGGYAPTVNFDELNPNKHQDIRNRLVQGIAQYAPFAIAGGASLPGQIGAGAAFGATQTEAGAQNAAGFLPSGKIGGAIESAAINALTHGLLKGTEALRPSKMFRGNLSPEQLQRNLDITQGTETGLGDVIGSPFLKKRLENTLTTLPFSGANESLQRTGQEVVSRGEDIVAKMLGTANPETIPEDITKDLLTQFEKQRTIKNNIYNEFNEEADKQFIDMKLPRFAETARKYKDAIESTNILKYEPELKSILSKLGVYESPMEKVEEAFNPTGNKLIGDKLSIYKIPTAKEATLLKGKLYEYKNNYAASPESNDRFMAKIFREMHSAIRQDIHEAVENSGNPRVKELYNNAEENYKKNFSKFLDKEIYRYIGGNKNPEKIITDFIKTSPNEDLATRITKIASTLQPQSRNQLAYGYFSRALDNEGNLNPAKMGTAIKKLKPKQFKALVPDETLRKQLKDYSKLQHMNKEAQNLMFNPNTGQRNRDAIITGILGLLGHGATGNFGALLAPTAAIAGGKLMTKALTSENLRNALVKKMIENQALFSTPAKIGGAQGIAQALAKALGQ